MNITDSQTSQRLTFERSSPIHLTPSPSSFLDDWSKLSIGIQTLGGALSSISKNAYHADPAVLSTLPNSSCALPEPANTRSCPASHEQYIINVLLNVAKGSVPSSDHSKITTVKQTERPASNCPSSTFNHWQYQPPSACCSQEFASRHYVGTPLDNMAALSLHQICRCHLPQLKALGQEEIS